MLVCALIFSLRHWSDLHMYTGLLCCLGLPVFFFIPESPRWLAVNNRKDEAEDVFLGRIHFSVHALMRHRNFG